jgi:hypothetical protein
MPDIPTPELIGDTLAGCLIRSADGLILILGDLPPGIPPERIMRPAGSLTVRYAIAYLQREAAIVPGLFASDLGDILVGREAWDFTMDQTNLYPRADILGLRDDGRDDQVTLKNLDLGRPITVLVYATPEDRLPLGRLAAFWAPVEAEVPDLLAKHLPRLKQLPA